MAGQPNNPNPLSPINFRFNLVRAPELTFFVQSAALPQLSIGEPLVENIFVKLPIPGDKLQYAPISLRFQVNEDLSDWLEIHDWMVGLGFPDNFTESIHKSFGPDSASGTATQSPLDRVYSDGTLHILTSDKNPNIQVTFKDMFPISLSSLQFDISQPDITYLEADVEFTYRSYTVKTG